jgi:D-aminopeptidase
LALTKLVNFECFSARLALVNVVSSFLLRPLYINDIDIAELNAYSNWIESIGVVVIFVSDVEGVSGASMEVSTPNIPSLILLMSSCFI